MLAWNIDTSVDSDRLKLPSFKPELLHSVSEPVPMQEFDLEPSVPVD